MIKIDFNYVYVNTLNNIKIVNILCLIIAKNLRIHIVPVGYDSTRVTEPLLSKKADKVYFIRHVGDKGYSRYYDFITSELHDTGIEIHEEFVDIWDLFQCIRKFKEIVNSEKDNHFYVNVSTGSKITAIAGMLTSMLMPHVEPYYVHIEYSSQKIQKKIKKDVVKESNELPVFEINQPPNEYLVTLSLLSKYDYMKKSKLIEELEEKNIIKQKDMNKSFFSEHAKHSQLRAILDPMERNWDFINIEGKGKKSRVKITSQGNFALKIFDESKT